MAYDPSAIAQSRQQQILAMLGAPYSASTFNLSPAPTSGSGTAWGKVPGQLSSFTPTTIPFPATASATLIGSPSTVEMPNPFADLSKLYPNLAGANTQSANIIASQMSGKLNPDVAAQIQDQAAAWGVGAGVPGSGMQWSRGLRDIGLTSAATQQQGLTNYASLLPMIAQTQTVSPGVQAQIGEFNSGAQNQVNAANAAAQNQMTLANTGAQNTVAAQNAAILNQAGLTNLSIAEQNALNLAAPDPAMAAAEQERLYNAYLARMGGGPGAGTGFSMISPADGTGGYGFPAAASNANRIYQQNANFGGGGMFTGTLPYSYGGSLSGAMPTYGGYGGVTIGGGTPLSYGTVPGYTTGYGGGNTSLSYNPFTDEMSSVMGYDPYEGLW